MYRAKKDKKEFHISEDQVKVYKDAGYTVEKLEEATPSEPENLVEKPKKTKAK